MNRVRGEGDPTLVPDLDVAVMAHMSLKEYAAQPAVLATHISVISFWRLVQYL